MDLVTIFVASLLPGVAWIWFFHRQDRFEKEPPQLIMRSFLFGALAVVPAILWELPFRPWFGEGQSVITHFFVAFFVVGLGEELVKFLAVFLAVYRNRELNEVMDGIVYGVSAAIGFSVVENMLYTANFGWEVAPIRAFVASLAHASFSGYLGYYLGLAKFAKQPTTSILKGLLLATFFHGLYDFLLIARIGSPLMVLVLVALVYYSLRNKIKEALSLSPFTKD